jgi:outer membrane immunogenic protein
LKVRVAALTGEVNMRHTFKCALVMGAFVTGTAHAADLPNYNSPIYSPAPQVSNWQGLYVGGHVGYRFGSVANSGFDPSGFSGGLSLGYDWQNQDLVIGAVTDLNLSGAKDRVAGARFDERWFGTTRARIGYSFGNVLPYLTAGIAYGGLRLNDGLGGVEGKTHFGWTVGAGMEVRLTGNWSATAEYLYIDLGERAYALTGQRHDYDASLVKLGVNYRF